MRERKKPEVGWVEKSKYELAKELPQTINKAYKIGMIRGEKEQKRKDLEAMRFVLYNALEIGDISCKDIETLIGNIEKYIEK